MARSTRCAPLVVSLLVALSAPSAVWAQGVFKCTVGGKTVYQASPCEGQGKSLELARGPSEQQVEEARKRAAADKSQGVEADARMRQRSQQQTQRVAQNSAGASRADCTSLSQRRAAAFGRRNGAFRQTRQDNIDRSADVIAANNEIATVEAQMTQAGCSMQ
jgi:hypothetical protein